MVGGRVSEPLAGRIRLQWWRDSIDMLAEGEPRRHAVLEALAVRVPDPAKLHRLVDARELDLEDAPFADHDALETYVADTSGVLSELALDLLEVADGATRDSAGHVARAWGLVGLLRAAPFHARARRMTVPADALRRHAVPPGAYLELRGGPELGALARETGELAAAALELARRPVRYAAAAPVLLPATLARLYLARLAAVDWNMFDPRVTAPVPHAVFRLVLARLLRRV